MTTRKPVAPLIGVLTLLALAALGVQVALAHCDGLDGPVVKAAKNALETGNVNLVLIWVQQKDEPEIRDLVPAGRRLCAARPRSAGARRPCLL